MPESKNTRPSSGRAVVPKKPKSKPAKAPELPDWIADTPYDVAYRLVMRDSSDGEYSQVVELTRKEFLILKVCLAKLRGIVIPTTSPDDPRLGTLEGDPVWSELEPEEIAAVEVKHAN
jgi:hypothetical protein